MIRVEKTFRDIGDRESNLDRNAHFSTPFWSLSYMLDGFKEVEPHFVSKFHATIHSLAQQLPTKASFNQLRLLIMDSLTDLIEIDGKASAVFYIEAEGRAGYLSAGDTRIYWLNRSQRTIDHTRAQEYIDDGSSPPDSINKHPYRKYLTRSLSQGRGNSDLDESSCKPLEPGEPLLMCTDGFWCRIPEEQLYHCKTAAILTAAFREAMNRTIPNRDNMSVMLLIKNP